MTNYCTVSATTRTSAPTRPAPNALAAWWRPAMMICIMAVLFINYALLPLLAVFFPAAHPIVFPDKFWEIVGIVVGLYIAGRSGEKIANSFSVCRDTKRREPDEGTPPKDDSSKPKPE